ncbi:MAG: carbohydrate porin [Succinivibrionaceae bacterium]
MKANWLPLSAALALAISSVSASAVDFHGYARSGMIIDQGHKDGSNTLNKNKVGRLGNESDTYAEIALSEKVFDKAGVSFKFNSKIAYSSQAVNDWEDCGDGSYDKDKNESKSAACGIGLREINAEVTNVLGLDETLWVGKRFNSRNDIHITDFYYWDVSGESFGMEGAKIGPGRLGVSLTRSDRPEKEGIKSRNYILDLRYTSLDLGFGSLDLGIDYAFVNQTDAEKKATKNGKDGVMLTAQYAFPVLNGFNKTVAQWGTEGWSKTFAYYGGGNWYGAEALKGAKGGRLINWGVISPTEQFHFAHNILWSRSINMWNGMNSVENFDVVVRPEYAWNEFHKTILELGYGYANTKNENGSEGKDIQKKYTIAQAITAGSGFWTRPELRIFVSYKDNPSNDAKFTRGDSTTSSHEIQYGAQMEAWW